MKVNYLYNILMETKDSFIASDSFYPITIVTMILAIILLLPEKPIGK